MHAYLLVGSGVESILNKAQEIADEKSSKLTEVELKKIENVRNLNNLTRLRLTSNITYLIKNIDQASEEALNAFLKNLEEPQSGLTYILTTQNLSSVLPTIVSRSQVIKINEEDYEIDEEKMKKFTDLAEGEKLEVVDKIKEREEAIQFLQDYIKYVHTELADGENLKIKSKNLKTALTSLTRLQANGNVSLQLANFVVNLI